MADVIYVEDEDTVALIFKIGLAAQQINVLHIPDTEPEHMALFDTPEYQAAKAVFIDLWVGGVNGLNIAQTLREKGDTRPFFLLTAGENPSSTRLNELNMTFLRKPIGDYKKLAEMINNL
jgi:DNA-binding response OmpR family regulator